MQTFRQKKLFKQFKKTYRTKKEITNSRKIKTLKQQKSTFVQQKKQICNVATKAIKRKQTNIKPAIFFKQNNHRLNKKKTNPTRIEPL